MGEVLGKIFSPGTDKGVQYLNLTVHTPERDDDDELESFKKNIEKWLTEEGMIQWIVLNKPHESTRWIPQPVVVHVRVGIQKQVIDDTGSDTSQNPDKLKEIVQAKTFIRLARLFLNKICQGDENNRKSWLTLNPSPKFPRKETKLGVDFSEFTIGTMTNSYTFISSGYDFDSMTGKLHIECLEDLRRVYINLELSNLESEYRLSLEHKNFFEHITVSIRSEDIYIFIHLKDRPLIWKDSLRVTNILPAITTSDVCNSDIIQLKIEPGNALSKIFMALVSRKWTFQFTSCTHNYRHHLKSNLDRSLGEMFIQKRSGQPEYQEDVQYLIAVLLSRGDKMKDKLEESASFLSWLMKEDGAVTLRMKTLVVKRILDMCDGDPYWYNINLDDALKQALVVYKENIKEKPSKKSLVKRAILTPTRILLQVPQENDGNRVIRENEPDCLMRLNIRDDNLCQLEEPDEVFLKEIISARLVNGMLVAGRKFHYLAESNSQLKEHSCCLYAKDSRGKTSDDVRESIGDLSNIRCVGKYAKRLGQAFSKTTKGMRIPKKDYIVEKDILSLDKKYCFSEGIGRISVGLAQKVKEHTTKRKDLPSAFQIRFGGAKGVLTVDKKLRDKKMVLRESMVKFRSQHDTLDIQSVSVRKRLFLNHQILILLSGMGIKDETFFKLQERDVDSLLWSLMDEGKARQCLRMSVAWLLPIYNLERINCQITAVPFLRKLLLENAKHSIFAKMMKARIAIPDQYGRNMMGVLDETGKLQYGQVFIQYASKINGPPGHYHVLKGDVIVSKMPGLHPGDVRKLQAIEVSELSHLKDVIVFPQKGKRPHPDEMAGSDLDGDEYWVTWSPELIFKRSNYEAMAYTPDKPKEQDTPVTEKDLIENVEFFIRTDITSIAATEHLCQADQLGIFSDKCLQLAEIHSRAVDACKTGIIVEIPKNLHSEEQPDFLEKDDRDPSYESMSILGKLHRQYKELHKRITLTRCNIFQGNNQAQFIPGTRILLCRPSKHDKELVNKAFTSYKEQLNQLLHKYGFEKEVDLLLCAPAKNRKGSVNKSDVYSISEDIKENLKNLKGVMRSMLLDPDTPERRMNLQVLGNRAIACFQVSEAELVLNEDALGQSFPWLFADWLHQADCEQNIHIPITKILGRKCLHHLKDVFSLRTNVDRICTTKLQNLDQKSLKQLTEHKGALWSYLFLTGIKCEQDSQFLRQLVTYLLDATKKRDGYMAPSISHDMNPKDLVGSASHLMTALSNEKEFSAVIQSDSELIGHLVTDILITSLHCSTNNNPFHNIVVSANQNNPVGSPSEEAKDETRRREVLSEALSQLMMKHNPMDILGDSAEYVSKTNHGIAERTFLVKPEAWETFETYTKENPIESMQEEIEREGINPKSIRMQEVDNGLREIYFSGKKTDVERIWKLILDLQLVNFAAQKHRKKRRGFKRQNKKDIICHKCKVAGHKAKDCLQNPRRTRKIFCYKCGGEGHMKRECTMRVYGRRIYIQ